MELKASGAMFGKIIPSFVKNVPALLKGLDTPNQLAFHYRRPGIVTYFTGVVWRNMSNFTYI